jgi:hypothetical protein
LSSRSSNHSRAVVQSHFTVRIEMWSASAVSSTLNPADEPHLDHLTLSLIARRQRLERLIDREEIAADFLRHDQPSSSITLWAPPPRFR